MSELIKKAKENVPKVYDAGHKVGVEEGYDNGLDAAIDVHEEFLADKPKTHYDTFWDSFQNKGNRTNYFYAFYSNGGCWNDITFNPKYNIIPEGSVSNLFRYCACADIWGICKKNNVTIDLSNATDFSYAFANISTAELGIIDISKATTANATAYMFAYNFTRVKSIEKLISSEATVYNKNNTFSGATGLENLIVEGVIGKDGFNVQWSTNLNKASIKSIINALSSTTTGLTVTLSATAVNKAFETSEGLADGSTSAEWITLAGNETTDGIRPNWTILLV